MCLGLQGIIENFGGVLGQVCVVIDRVCSVGFVVVGRRVARSPAMGVYYAYYIYIYIYIYSYKYIYIRLIRVPHGGVLGILGILGISYSAYKSY